MHQRPHRPKTQQPPRESAEIEAARSRMSLRMQDRRRMQQDGSRRLRRPERGEHKR